MNAMGNSVPDYPQLLAQTVPSVIHSEEENQHFISLLEELEHRSSQWSEAEAKLAELLTFLIEEFEDRNYQLRAATPAETLLELMEANDLKQKDLVDVFGAESTVSAVINGKREMTTEHIKKLSDRFNVSPAVFF